MSERPHPQAFLLAVGDELMQGRTVDTNSSWIAARLRDRGLDCAGILAVPDDMDAIRAALDIAAARASLIVVTGGIGPTFDDLTRDAVAAWSGLELLTDDTWRKLQEKRRRERGFDPGDGPAWQSRYPAGGALLTNPIGTAGGVRCRHKGADIYCLPGVPAEMKAMAELHLFPAVAGEADATRPMINFGVCGVPESDVAARMHSIMKKTGEACRFGVYASGPMVRIACTAPDAATAGDVGQALRAEFGNDIYTERDEPVWETVARLLMTLKKTVGVAESCTGGLIGSLLTKSPGISDVFLEGCVTYSNDAKIRTLRVPEEILDAHGAVSAETARAMARGMRERANVDYAIAVTGIAGPGGGSVEKPVGLVYAALAGPGGVQVDELRLRGDRERVQFFTAVLALDLLRRALNSSTDSK